MGTGLMILTLLVGCSLYVGNLRNNKVIEISILKEENTQVPEDDNIDNDKNIVDDEIVEIDSKVEDKKVIETDSKQEDKEVIETDSKVEGKEVVEYIKKIEYSKPIELPINDSLGLINYQTKAKQLNLLKGQLFPEVYTKMEGILTFRGNNFRNTASYGRVDVKDAELDKIWEFTTKSSSFGAGAGWTGQPSIIKWSDEVKQIMNIKDKFKEKEDFVEVIYASLDGKIYFFDLETGEQTREPINTKNPIKGSVSIDPRGWPILYVGQGISENNEFGFRIFNLINGERLYFINVKDSYAYRGWGAFDGSPVINRETDTLILGGENGIFYNLKLNTNFDLENKTVSIKPETTKYRYKIIENHYQGIENSIAIYKNLAYFADNGGAIQCFDLRSMEPKWVWYGDSASDTNATLTIELVDDTPYLYVGTEQQGNGTNGKSFFRKMNGLTGEVVWEKEYRVNPIYGLNGGFYGTSVIGKEDIRNLVIVPLAGYKSGAKGLLIAFDKRTGEEVWKWDMPNYTWSSPVDIYDTNGKSYIIQCDSAGRMNILDGSTGIILNKVDLGANIESSPAIYNDMVVVATRAGKMYGVKIK